MFTSIQRYLLVFHKAFYIKWKALTHYSTLLFCCLYPPIHYVYFNLFYPCTNTYDYTQPLCGQACFTYVVIVDTIDNIMNILLPVSTIVVVNCIILTKVILMKRRIASNKSISVSKDRTLWKKNRRLIIQFMTIASATSLAWLPFVICATAQTFDNTFISGNVLTLLNYLPYFNCLLTPFLAVVTLPRKINAKLVVLTHCCRWKRGAKIPSTTKSPAIEFTPNNIDLKPMSVDDVSAIVGAAVDEFTRL